MEEFSRDPDKQARSCYVDDEVGNPAIGMEAEKAEDRTAYGGAYDADDNIPEEASTGVHHSSGYPAHQRTHNQGT
jgi:hypothetical protein